MGHRIVAPVRSFHVTSQLDPGSFSNEWVILTIGLGEIRLKGY